MVRDEPVLFRLPRDDTHHCDAYLHTTGTPGLGRDILVLADEWGLMMHGKHFPGRPGNDREPRVRGRP